MHAGLGLLRLEATAFWRLTPVELAAALGTLWQKAETPGHDGLRALMRLYPDGGAANQERNHNGPG